jgi:hypothetical protein
MHNGLPRTSIGDLLWRGTREDKACNALLYSAEATEESDRVFGRHNDLL